MGLFIVCIILAALIFWKDLEKFLQYIENFYIKFVNHRKQKKKVKDTRMDAQRWQSYHQSQIQLNQNPYVQNNINNQPASSGTLNHQTNLTATCVSGFTTMTGFGPKKPVAKVVETKDGFKSKFLSKSLMDMVKEANGTMDKEFGEDEFNTDDTFNPSDNTHTIGDKKFNAEEIAKAESPMDEMLKMLKEAKAIKIENARLKRENKELNQTNVQLIKKDEEVIPNPRDEQPETKEEYRKRAADLL